tara:strand:- start:220 stop:534 length:315 start_codon:yes stop_codon:yes gene_type:complete
MNYIKNIKIFINNNSCCICLENNLKVDKYKHKLNNCTFYAHKKCLKKWLKIKPVCIICKKSFVLENNSNFLKKDIISSIFILLSFIYISLSFILFIKPFVTFYI